MTSADQQAFRHLFDGTVEQYDPWDAAHLTAGPPVPRHHDVLGSPHVNQVFPADERWHTLLLRALRGVPDVRADDSS